MIKMKSIRLFLALIFACHLCDGNSMNDQSEQTDLNKPFSDDEGLTRTINLTDIEVRVNTLLGKMTLAEKLGQLQQLEGVPTGNYLPEHLEMARNGSLGSTLHVRGARIVNELQTAALQSRLQIPILLGFDVIHGYRTLFPIPLGEAASWDLEAAEKSAAIAAAEAKSVGLHWTFAPMVDISRDPRWGRVMEGAGEDVFLNMVMAKARVRGFQGTDYSQNDKVMACAKHFAAYGAAEAGRDYNTVDMSERRLREVYLPPFKAAVDAGVGSFMTAFNDLNGVPATANQLLLRQILRDEWKFDGLVISDYKAVAELINHGLAADGKEAAMYALNGGTDMEMLSTTYIQHGEELLHSGKVSIQTIDNAVRNVLRVKFRLGLFENPFANEQLENSTLKKPEFLQAAREISAKSFVLLKNERETLPINIKNITKLAVVGALADDRANTLDWWPGDARAEDSITILQGITDKLNSVKAANPISLIFAKGCESVCTSVDAFPEAVEAAKQADITVVVVGETREVSGEAGSLSNINLSGRQLDLVQAIHATGKPYVVVLKNGRPLTIDWLAENAPAILVTWHAGTMGGPAVADVLFGDVNPAGKLPMTFPRNVGQIPIHYDFKNTGRPFNPNDSGNRYTSKYIDALNTPLYAFGFGLSYTTFTLQNLTLNANEIRTNEQLTVSVDLENTGSREGEEVVQLYVQDVAASITRPTRQLKGFQKVALKDGQKRRVEFVLMPTDLGFLDANMQPIVEAGAFKVFVGSSSDAVLSAQFSVVSKSPSTTLSTTTEKSTATSARLCISSFFMALLPFFHGMH